MPEKLTKYRGKRDPGSTNEPFGAELLHSAGGTAAGSFVVHLHDATRRHYDLRIEIGGVLKSFAIPRGPSLNPEEKRLAVHTEDHPIDYLEFEAVIPAGNYGAGAMILWDRGGVKYLEGTAEEGVARGKIDFELFGHKLRGRFGLIKTSGRQGQPEPKQQQWLLVKKRDQHVLEGEDIVVTADRSVLSGMRVEDLARAPELAARLEERARALGATAPFPEPRKIVPMACGTGDGPVSDPAWLYELKMDGVRIVACRDGEAVNLRYRTGRNATISYPEVARAVQALYLSRVILDGEIVAYDPAGKPNFQLLGPRIQATREHEARRAARSTAIAYLVFDLLAVGDLDLRGLPLSKRKALLSELLPGRGLVRALDHIVERGDALLEFCRSQGLEGMVAKRADSRYLQGPVRTGHWVKHKCLREDDFVVVGYTVGSGSREALGALELASYMDGELRLRGRVGSGLSEASIELLLSTLAPLRRDACPAQGELLPTKGALTFVEPHTVVNVRYIGWTNEGRVRQGVFCGLRADVAPEACQAAPTEELEAIALEQADRRQLRAAGNVMRGRVELSNQDKVFWPEERYTKGDLCNYYDAIADTALPYLRDRPVLMTRYPDGIEGKSFFQWNVPRGLPSWIETFSLRSEDHDDKNVVAFLVNDRDTLVYMANLGAIPLHVLASRSRDLDRCDFLTIDFDLGGAPLRDAIVLARELRGILDELGLASFPKTSGQTGMHVLVALGGVPFTTAKILAELLGRLLHLRHPDLSTIERMRKNRRPGVYIDTGQTGRSRAIVAPYSVRAHPGATVSTPLHWDEVGFNLDPRRHTIFSVPERMATVHDPLAGLLTERPDIAGAVSALARLLPASPNR